MEDRDRNPGEVFAIPDLWGPSRLLNDKNDLTSHLFSELRLDEIDQKLPNLVQESSNHDIFFHIPDHILGLQSASSPSQPVDGAENAPEILEPEEEEGDIWLFSSETPIRPACFQSWDAFENRRPEEYHTPYLTEAGPSIFDTVIAAKEDHLRIGNTEHVVLDSKIYIASVLALGLGRGSVLFTWDEDKQAFHSNLLKMRTSGYTGESLDGFLVIFFECGNTTRFLKNFIDKSYMKHASSGRIALADSISSLLAIIQSRLSASTTTSKSLLQLQSNFRPVRSILSCFKRIVVNAEGTRSDEAMLSTIFEEIQLLEHRTDTLRDILLEILARVSQPWLEFTSEWLGLQRETGVPLTREGNGKSFVKVDNREWVDEQGFELNEPDYVLDYDRVPSFITLEDARAIFEVGRSLRFLKTHHAEHPLAKPEIVESAQPPMLEWKFSWEDIIQVEAKASKYEESLKSAIRDFSINIPSTFLDMTGPSNPDPFILDFFGKPEEEMQAHVLASIDTFNQPFDDCTAQDRLSISLNAYFSTNTKASKSDQAIFAPPVSLSPLLSFNPIIAIQARMVNTTCMRMFFNSHQLREHLSVQRQFHLLGNGVFSSRLSHALFDPELESAERHKDIARSGGIMGLRLGGRDTWPPASSELRLALMGVLTESYVSSQPLKLSNVGTFLDQPSLPGDLSFAVREMSEEEIENCMDPNSIEALDFLRLSYKPPSPLEAIITPIILFKYDQLFKLLLRIIRMLYVVTALFRDAPDRRSHIQPVDHISQRFRIEAQHFVSSIAGYFFDTGIEATWQIFERKLDQIEQHLASEDDDVLGQSEGLDKLRDYHERVLDRIMFALLLRKRQQPVMKLLEDIFTLILQFSKYEKERAIDSEKVPGTDGGVKEIYLRFRKKIGVFIIVCRGMSEKKGYGDKKSLGISGRGGLFDGNDLVEETTISQLLSRLEMSGYYSRPIQV